MHFAVNTGLATPTDRDIDFLETYTPEEISSDIERGEDSEASEGRNSSGRREDGGGREGGVERQDNVFMYSPSPRLELKLPRYRSGSENASSEDSVSRQVSHPPTPIHFASSYI